MGLRQATSTVLCRHAALAAALFLSACPELPTPQNPPASAPSATPAPSLTAAPPALRSLTVTATAYNSLPGQTGDSPHLTASGELLHDGKKVIAVSSDLFREGLTFGTEVEISGLPGRYRVADVMHSRWRRRIDIYMDNDLARAKRWGRRRVTVRWEAAADSAR